MKNDLTVERVASRDVLHCPPEMPLCEAAARMVETRCSSIVVMEEGRPLGIWTERDAIGVDLADAEVYRRPIREFMSTPVKSLPATTRLGDAALRFRQERVRHFLVTGRGGGVFGVVTQTDVVLHRGIEYYLRLLDAGTVMRRSPLQLEGGLSVAEVARRLREVHDDAVVLLEEGKATGILTERDMVRLVANGQGGASLAEVASRPLVTVDASASLYFVRTLLSERGIRHVGVVEAGGALVGMVSFTDLLASAEHAYVEELRADLAEQALALNVSRRHLRLAEKVIESTLEGVLVTDLKGVIQSVNPAFTRVTGYTAEEVVGRTPALLSSGRYDHHFYRQMWGCLRRDGIWQGEIWNRRKNGEIYPEFLTITTVTDEEGQPAHYAAIFSDISALKESEQRIEQLAYHDILTDLPNQRLFKDALSAALFTAHQEQGRLAVMMISLDRFQRVNESLGHEAGDEMLRQVGARLNELAGEEEMVSRWSSDEFMLLKPRIRHTEDAIRAAWMIVEGFSHPFTIAGSEVLMTVSIGIALYPEDGVSAELLMMNADAAMYRAKGDGRSSFQLYNASMSAKASARLELEAELRRALSGDQFQVFYQPIVDAASEKVTGAEALLRWHHPEKGQISPVDFIPVAEDCGLIGELGEWVLRQVCRQINQCRLQRGIEMVPVAINISGLQFREPDFIVMVKDILKETGVDPGRLRFELTESVIMDNAEETIEMLRQISDMGIRISVDDFGTGYSSLAYLKRFPISTLKIDRSFVMDLTRDADDAAIVHAIVTLAHSLRLNVVAEGVEEQEQLLMLGQEGCDYIQGFYFSRPIPATEFADRFLVD